jgi:hypothetical protein
MAAGLLFLSGATPTSGVVFISVAVAFMGAGMGLVIAPAGESILGVLPEEQGGVGSAVNDTVQELGGSLGVAVIGSLVSAAYTDHLHAALSGTPLPAAVQATARSSIAAADAVGAQLTDIHPELGTALTAAAHTAFTTAMTTGFTVAGIVAAVGAVLVAIALPAKQRVLGKHRAVGSRHRTPAPPLLHGAVLTPTDGDGEFVPIPVCVPRVAQAA